MNEIKATLQNRIQIKLLNLRIDKLERQQILSLTKTNRFISLVMDDLKEVRSSTGHSRFIEEEKKQEFGGSSFNCRSDFSSEKDSTEVNDEICNIQKDRSNTLPDLKKIDDEFSNLKLNLRTNSSQRPKFSFRIEELKKKDPIFFKRYKKIELTKQYGRVPIFSEYDNKIRVNWPKCVIDKKKKELIEISNKNFNLLNKEKEIKGLNEKVALFVKNYQLIT